MIRSRRHMLLSWMLTLTLLFNIFFPLTAVYAASVESILTNVTAIVSQNGVEIGENGTLNSTNPVSVEISFGVPVQGDEPTPSFIVSQGDTATFALSDAFQLISTSTIELKMGEIKVGEVNFITDPGTKMVSAHVTFNGDDEVFDGTSSNVQCRFTATFQYDASGAPDTGNDYTVAILGKTFTLTVPPKEIQYDVEKSGTPNLAEKTIDWAVTVSAVQGSTPVNLSGYDFADDLSTVGEYVPGSFAVDGVVTDPAISGDAIRYAFPEGSSGPQVVTFKTVIADENYYSSGQQLISNKAQLLKDEVVIEEGQAEVSFTPAWIKKEGKSSDAGSSGVYDPTNRTITWTITANQMGAALNNVVITDVLPTGLTFQEATWQPWNGTTWGAITNIVPNENEFTIGDIHSMILLTIVTKVPDEAYATGVTNYTNSASIRWEGLTGSGIGSGSITVGVGYNAIDKSGTADPDKQQVHWNVTVDTKGQTIPDLKVYDLLIYGSSASGFVLNQASGFPSGLTPSDLTPRYDQKYVAGSLSGSGLTITVHPITQDGVRVGDLMEITGLSTSAINTFTFDTQVLNPAVIAGNKSTTIWNTASLFSAHTKLNASTDDVQYISQNLAKEMLKREAMTNPAAGVNIHKTTSASQGFDYKEKAVIFRLSVNADGTNLSEMVNASGQTLGKATVTDTLPEGWEFQEITNGSMFLIFEGTGNSDKTVEASDTIPDNVSLSAIVSGGAATFTFDPLDKAYVILVKAGPTEETAEGYFNANKTTPVRNNLSLHTENWNPGVTTHRDVSITSQLLSKELASPAAGTLQWTVNYKPYEVTQPGIRIEDTLPLGIDLRTDSSGALLLTGGNIQVHEMTLNADGSYTVAGEVPLILDDNVSYDNAKRLLSFQIPDSSKAYRFRYVTDITGTPGTITNQVSLYGESAKQEGTSKPYGITAADGEATLQRNGWIQLEKKDGEGAPLAGAEFALLSTDEQTIIRKGVTGADGTLKLKVIPDGTYILRETKAPDGYTREARDYSVTVTTTGTTVVASINGKTGSGSNVLSVTNYREGTAGNLTISKMVAGNAGDLTKEFDFTLTWTGAPGTYAYVGNGVPDGTVKSGDRITLAHGQSITIIGLPKNASYAAIEANYSGAGYTTTSTGDKGLIEADATKVAAFVNVRNSSPSPAEPKTGSLTITKGVTGQGGDLSRKFDFTISFKGATGPWKFTGTGVAGGTIRSGDKISLGHGQSISIEGLPAGTGYTVVEADYSDDGYITTKSGTTGTIAADKVSVASFTNQRSIVTSEPAITGPGITGPGNPGDPNFNIGEGDIPQGTMEGGDEGGMPKTGGSQALNLAKFGLLFFSIALTVLTTMEYRMRRRFHLIRKSGLV